MPLCLPRNACATAAKSFALMASLALVLGGCASTTTQDPRAIAERNQKIIDSPIRTDQDRTMDARRKPAELLAFAQVKPGMQVLDVSAGGGYTSQVLALAVGPTGMVWAQRQQPGDALTKRLADNPQANLVVALRPLESPVPEGAPKLDLVTLILNYHDISYLPVDRARMNQAIFAALKPGGYYVLIDHSAKAGSDISSGKTLHRIDEAIVVAEVQKAGFVLQAQSDAWRDPADNREISSGDSKIPTDRFALRFVKP
ncbi:MAG TPA: SAM-dependent methyltransferase [Casimicrobiaceae bacterium]|nr:SAM-dependent methyltransferase [Casimicrobiaceae bacterium]